MKVNGIGSVGAGPGTAMVDRIMEAEAVPVEAAKQRKERVVAQKNEFSSLGGMLDELGGLAGKMQLPSGFNTFKFESSHPDILDGVISGPVAPGSFEMEVRGLAQADKHLDFGFPDVDKTDVGFGFMSIARGDGPPLDVVLDPGSTLRDAVDKINAAGAGVRAQIVNTGMSEDPFKLLVSSVETGEAARIEIDTDTSFLDFKNIKAGRDLDVMFEDVAVSRAKNSLEDLVEGVKMTAKRAEPGTRVQVNVTHDVDKTLDNVKAFTEKYNQVLRSVNGQYQVDAEGKAGSLAGDGAVRSLQRTLQGALQSAKPTGKFGSLGEIGVKTNAKTGEIEVDEQKLKAALASDYEGVAAVFTQTEAGEGLAAKLASAVKTLKDPMHGVVSNRLKGLDQSIKQQDKQIERQTERLAERREHVERQMANLDAKLNGMQQQGDFIQSRLAPPAQAQGGGNG